MTRQDLLAKLHIVHDSLGLIMYDQVDITAALGAQLLEDVIAELEQEQEEAVPCA